MIDANRVMAFILVVVLDLGLDSVWVLGFVDVPFFIARIAPK